MPEVAQDQGTFVHRYKLLWRWTRFRLRSFGLNLRITSVRVPSIELYYKATKAPLSGHSTGYTRTVRCRTLRSRARQRGQRRLAGSVELNLDLAGLRDAGLRLAGEAAAALDPFEVAGCGLVVQAPVDLEGVTLADPPLGDED